MPSKQRGDNELASRLREVCDSMFGGSTPRMAEALNLSQPAVWRVLSGKQPLPSGAFLTALAMFPDVDMNWLLRGEGEPPKPRQSLAIPIAHSLLKGSPHRCQDQLSGDSFDMAADYYQPSRYFLEVQPNEPVIRSSEMKIGVRDLLLMETDRRRFPPAERLYHLCGFRVPKRRSQLKLGFVSQVAGDFEDGPAHLEADTFDSAVDESQLIRRSVIVERSGRPPMIHVRNYIRVGGRETPVSDLQLEPVPTKIEYSEIVAVCVLLVRRQVPSVF